MSNEPEKISVSETASQKNINSKSDHITQEPILCPPTNRFYNSTDDAKDYAASLGQYVPLEEPDFKSSTSGSYKSPTNRTSNGSNSRGRKQKFQSSWQAKSDNSLKRNSREKNDEQCCDFCCLCLANFCLHFQ